ncbi:AgmX/PglI C-terminal domain-containing protein [bacterium]|nr:MAG: AgmX/PglI C-terminal domain-containing protein [bacterium]
MEKRRKPQPKTPAHLKREWMTKEDRHFSILMGCLYLFMVISNVYLASIYKKEPPKLEKVPERFAKLVYEAPQAKTRVKKEIEEKKKKEEALQAKEEKRPANRVEEKMAEVVREAPKAQAQAPSGGGGGGGGIEPSAEQMAQRREAIRKEVSKKGLLGVLGGRGGAATSSGRASILSGGGRAVDLDKILDAVGSGGLRPGANGGAGGSGDGTGGEWKGQSIGGASIDAAASGVAAASKRVANLEKRQDTAVKSAETVSVDDISTKEAVAIINRTVETYLGGIRYLYNRELRKNPDLEGKVTISITINPDGTVGAVSLVETTMNAPELVDGIIARIKRWTFPQVAQKPITVKYPFVFFPSM